MKAVYIKGVAGGYSACW